jgi:polysaccharide transporter, PST family
VDPELPQIGMRGLATAGFVTVLGSAALGITGWLRTKGLAVTLGPAGFGAYGQVWAFAQYAGAVGGLGIGLGATKMIAERRQRGDAAGLLRVSSLTLRIPLLGGLALFVFALALTVPISHVLLGRAEYWLVALGALSIPFVALQTPKQHVLQGLEDARGPAVVSAAYGAIFTVAAVGGAIVAEVPGAVVGLLIGNIALAGLYVFRERQLVRPYRQRLPNAASARTPLRSPETRELVRVGLAATLVMAMVAVVDIFVRSIIRADFGDAEVGQWYALLLLSSQFIAVIAGSLSYFTGPLVARIKETGDFAQTSRVLNDSLRLTFVVIFPLLVVLALFRDPLVDILFSPSFDPIVQDIPIMLAGDSARLIAWTLGVALVPLGLTRTWVAIAIAGLLGYAGLAYLTVDELGATAGALGWAALWGVSAVATAAVLAVRRAWLPSARSALSFGLGSGALVIASLVPLAWAVAPVVLLCLAMVLVGTTATERAATASYLRMRRGSR